MKKLSYPVKDRACLIYDFGYTAMFASSADPRFHYLMYVPPVVADGGKVELLVAIHGTGRTSAFDFRNDFAEWCKWNQCAILCPIFPINVLGDGALSGYKYLQEGNIRYDKIVLSMVEEVAEKYGQEWAKFSIFGYSGGGHFAHRFAILHPQKLWAASIGAPGSVTLLDNDRDWWVGIKNIENKFGCSFSAKTLADVPVHMVVGALDSETWEITHSPHSKYYMPGANDAGKTRIDRLKSLSRSFENIGVDVRFDLVDGVSHDRMKVLDNVRDFLTDVLNSETTNRPNQLS